MNEGSDTDANNVSSKNIPMCLSSDCDRTAQPSDPDGGG